MTFWEVLAFHDRSTLWLWETVPTPFNNSTARGFPELSRKESVPDAIPLACGENVTKNPWLPSAGIVTGNDRPLKLNSGLLLMAEEIVTCAAAAVSVPG